MITSEALRTTVEEVFRPESGGRPSVPKVVILLTDDESTGDVPLEDVKKDIQKGGVRVFVIGIGPNANEDELKELTPTRHHLVIVSQVDNVTDVTPRVVDKVKQDTKDSESYRASFK